MVPASPPVVEFFFFAVFFLVDSFTLLLLVRVTRGKRRDGQMWSGRERYGTETGNHVVFRSRPRVPDLSRPRFLFPPSTIPSYGILFPSHCLPNYSHSNPTFANSFSQFIYLRYFFLISPPAFPEPPLLISVIVSHTIFIVFIVSTIQSVEFTASVFLTTLIKYHKLTYTYRSLQS